MKYDTFYAGFWFAVCFIGMFQDFFGKEKYIELVESHWVDIYWPLWIIPIIAIIYFKHGIDKRNRHDK